MKEENEDNKVDQFAPQMHVWGAQSHNPTALRMDASSRRVLTGCLSLPGPSVPGPSLIPRNEVPKVTM